MPAKRFYWSVVLLLISSVILTACSTGPVSYSTNAQDTIVRLTSAQGGMMPSGLYYREGSFPNFTLFGDGRVVYIGNNGLYEGHLAAAAIQQLLSVAVNDARFFELNDFIGPTCCDMPGSSLTITANGTTKSVSMSILEETSDSNSQEGRLLRVLKEIRALETSKDPAYTPTGGTVYAEVMRGDARPTTPPWPLPQITLAEVVKQETGLHLTGADAQAALQTAGQVQQFLENGVAYSVIAVPDSP